MLDSSTARQNSTELDSELDRARQSSTPRHMQSVSTCLDGLDSYSTATRQLLDSYSTATRQLLDRLDRQGLDSPSTAASTAARRSLDSSTARQPGLKFNPKVGDNAADCVHPSAPLAGSREGDCVLLGTSHLEGRFEAQNGAHDVWLSDES